ncbi:MAG: ABC transporter ATP-binding protein [Chloroflexota bacterium]|jgi:iron complex transport system ATP-binding protein|nr:ABC transporter ATP-binding protein [Chloroflexota bacterium]MDP6758462.1 ABC transporter ATP-binding protein [Chloroflexota bacterium]
MISESAAIAVDGLSFGYGGQLVLHDLDLRLAEGDLTAVIGPNGAGKTTLLNCINGLARPGSGRIELHGRDLEGLDARRRARIVATVPQELRIPFAYRVREIVALGRSPHLGFWGGMSDGDQGTVDEALAQTETTELQSRRFNELSGGERQRVVVALALAQQPSILLLDEPTTHLDLSHQIEILNLVRGVNRERNVTVLACLHDINLAAAFFRRMIVIDAGQLVADGPPGDVLTPDLMAEVFKIRAEVVTDPVSGQPRVVPHVHPNGDGHRLGRTDSGS